MFYRTNRGFLLFNTNLLQTKCYTLLRDMCMLLLKDPQNSFLIENERIQQKITRNEIPEKLAVRGSRV